MTISPLHSGSFATRFLLEPLVSFRNHVEQCVRNTSKFACRTTIAEVQLRVSQDLPCHCLHQRRNVSFSLSFTIVVDNR